MDIFVDFLSIINLSNGIHQSGNLIWFKNFFPSNCVDKCLVHGILCSIWRSSTKSCSTKFCFGNLFSLFLHAVFIHLSPMKELNGEMRVYNILFVFLSCLPVTSYLCMNPAESTCTRRCAVKRIANSDRNSIFAVLSWGHR